MARPHCPRRIASLPGVVYFKPAGIPLRDLDERILTLDQLESLRLADVESLPQIDAAARMGISRQTFSRILAGARRTVASCMTQGMAVRIEGGVVQLAKKSTKRNPPASRKSANAAKPGGR